MGRKESSCKKVNKNSYQKALLTVVALAFAFAVAVIALVVYVDPFFHYHKPLSGFPYQVDNQLSQNPGMAKNMEYDSAILGSSMTVNFNTHWFEELMGLDTIKLSYSAAFPKDQANIMEIIFEHNPDVKKIFLGIDVITYTGAVDQTKYPIPEYLYDDNLLNDVSYVLNKDVLLNYVLRPIADPEPTDLATVYASWWTEEYYNEEWVLHNYTSPKQVEEVTAADAYIPSVEENLTVNICPYIEANPQTEFVIFFPPYSILYWNDVLKENHLDATIEEYRYIANRLNTYDNVEVYFFPDREDIILDLNHYADYSHYHPDFNRVMTECFATGECLVAKEGTEEPGKPIDEYLAHMLEIVGNFDFLELLDRQ